MAILTLRDEACLWVGDRGADWTVSQQMGQCSSVLVQSQPPEKD